MRTAQQVFCLIKLKVYGIQLINDTPIITNELLEDTTCSESMKYKAWVIFY